LPLLSPPLQAQQAQLEAAQQQQETLVGRLYDGQRAREDAEMLQAQVRVGEHMLPAAPLRCSSSVALSSRCGGSI
jgi:hypothetical protein